MEDKPPFFNSSELMLDLEVINGKHPTSAGGSDITRWKFRSTDYGDTFSMEIETNVEDSGGWVWEEIPKSVLPTLIRFFRQVLVASEDRPKR